jgi:hypothetical protein
MFYRSYRCLQVVTGPYRFGNLAYGRITALLQVFTGVYRLYRLGELLDVVTIRHAVITQHVAVVPQVLDDG